MNVYVVTVGYDYQGEQVYGVHKTLQAARKQANEELKDYGDSRYIHRVNIEKDPTDIHECRLWPVAQR